MNDSHQKSKIDREDVPAEKAPKLTKEEINALPLRQYEGPVHLIRSEQDLERALTGLQKEDVLGFDTETKPSFKKGERHLPALLQLATRDAVYVFQLKIFSLPPAILDILANSGILKAGVAIGRDVSELKDISPFKPAGFIDLGEIAQKTDLNHHGLRSMTARLLGFRISKQAQLSDWSRAKLTSRQIRYAATDAWVSRKLYFALKEKGCLSV